MVTQGTFYVISRVDSERSRINFVVLLHAYNLQHYRLKTNKHDKVILSDSFFIY